MKKIILLLGLLILLFAACEQKQKEITKDGDSTKSTSTTPETANIEIECYQYIHNKDSIFLKIRREKSQVEGSLYYSLYQKDRNQGSFVGTIKEDSIFAEYTFQSEGRTSSREIFLVKKDSTIIEGFGSIIQKSSKTEFKNRDSLVLNEKIKLKRISCLY